MNEMNYSAANLMMAIRLAIIDQREVEKEHGFTRPSAFLGGLEEVYKHLQEGGQLRLTRN